MADGIGCVCGANSFAECGCPDVDWHPSEMNDLSDTVVRMRKALQITLGNIRSLAAAGNCRTFDEWEKSIIAALETPNVEAQGRLTAASSPAGVPLERRVGPQEGEE